MSALNSQLIPNITVIPIGSLASGMSITLPGMYFSKKSRIKHAYLSDQAGIVSNTSNKIAILLQDNAGSPNAYASVNTFGNAAPALGVVELTKLAAFKATDDNSGELEVPAGTMLNVNLVGSGTAVTTSAVLIVESYPL